MNCFNIVSVRADEGTLSIKVPPEVASKLNSESFRSFSDLRPIESEEQRIAVLSYMLTAVAIDPREIESTRKNLAKGVVMVRFFGVGCPVPMFFLDPDDPKLLSLMAQAERNIESPMMDAARRVLKWRDSKRTYLLNCLINTRERVLRDTLSWPSSEDFRVDAEAAREKRTALYAELDRHRAEVHGRRMARLRMFSQRAAPGVKTWTEFLEDVCLRVLLPMFEKDEQEALAY